VTINQPAICSITGNNIICAGNSTQLCVPAGALSYLWSNGQTGNCTTVNAAGNYSVTVTSVDGCRSICNKVVTVVPPTPCSISGNISICEGDSTKLCAPDNCGLYLWSNGATTHCIWVKTPGTYTVTITNSGGCTSVCSQAVVIGQSTCAITGDETICTGSTTQLCVPAGASAYLWSTGATTNCITVNATGYYCVTITNARGCTSVCSKTVTQLTGLNLTAAVTGNCSALGSITIATTGGTAPYTYLWASGQTTATIFNLASGTYTVTVTDANGCKGIKSVVITAGASSFSCNIRLIRTVTCFEAADGEAIVTVTGGTAPYTYRWSNGATLATGVYLKVGLNSVTVTDATGCATVCTIVLTVPDCKPLVNAGTISGEQTYCNSSELTGIFEQNSPLGGSGIIEYMWMYSDFTADFSQGGWSTIVGATGKDLPLSLLPNIVRKTNFIRCVRRIGCCEFIESNVISKTPTVVNVITGERYPCLNWANIFTAFDNGVGAFYQWSIEGATITTSNNRVANIIFTSLGRKNVTLTVIKNGCSQTRTTQIEVVNCSGNYGEIITFLSSVNNKKVRLDWVTTNENNASKYVIETSNDGFDFRSIGSIVSQNRANNVYTFTDNSPKIGRSFYRIHQLTPINEEVRLSKTEKILLGEEALSILVYPNPIDKTVFVEVVNDEITEGSIEVYNPLGLLIKTQYFTKNQVRYELELGELAAGNYIVRVRQNDGKTATAKMTKL
jgi:SprB repeat/Secretion system C-terminal sorting domain